MASAAASGVTSPATITSRYKGEAANLIRVKILADPAGTTGATTCSVSGNDITVKCKNTTGTITATNAEALAALSGNIDVQNLAAITTGAATGASGAADTALAYTGASAAFVPLSGGAEGTSTVGLDNLAAATGNLNAGGAKLINSATASGNGAVSQATDILEYISPAGDGAVRIQAAVAATGASAVVLARGRTKDKLARKGVGLGTVGV